MPKKNPDEVTDNFNQPEAPEMREGDELGTLRADNARLREQNTQTIDRLSRLEFAVGNANRMRKWDEMNDPEAMKKHGFVPSLDAKDPIVWWQKSGSCWMDDDNRIHDEQVVKFRTLSGSEDTFDLLHLNAACSGNSIKCQINNYEEYRIKEKAIDLKRQEYQRASGRTARVNTVELRKEIKAMEDDLKMNVTLSEDEGKSFTGKTIDVLASIFNGIA